MKFPKLFNHYGLQIALGLTFLILVLLMQIPVVAEWWTTSISRYYHIQVSWLIALIPFSIMEMLFVSWLITIAIYLIRSGLFLIKKHIAQMVDSFKVALTWFLILTNLYLATAGMAYQRLALPLPQYAEAVPYTQYVEVIEYFRDDFNHQASQLTFSADGAVINPHSLGQLNELIHAGFNTLDQQYFTQYSTTIKPLLTSFLYREFHITGIHFAPTTEALINTLIPDALIPFTMAHELAHAKGVMREEDANLVAMYICLTSNDPFIKYSGYFNTFYALLNLSRYIGEPTRYQILYQSLTEPIRRDYQYQGTFWAQYNVLDRFARWVNDTYLKLFGTEGVTSYVDVPVVTIITDGENTIEVIQEFSPFQKLFFSIYFTSYAF
jgi:hypothetical protein